MSVDPARCDELVPEDTSWPRFHQCERRWRYEVTERNGDTRHVCGTHLRRLQRLGAVADLTDGKKSEEEK